MRSRQAPGPEYGGSGFSWSADGKRIAFSRNDGTSGPGSQPTADIFTVGSAGGGQRQLTKTRDADDVNPVYSPNGKRIAWELRDHEDPHPGGCSHAVPANESQEIWAMNADGSRAFALTSHAPPCDFAPAWSPSGKRILFGQSNSAVRSPPGLVALSTMNADGGDQRVLVPTTRGPVNGVWSPNGGTVAFTGAQPAGVYVVRATGGTPARVRSAPGGSTVVDWARAPVPLCKKGQKSTTKKPCRKA